MMFKKVCMIVLCTVLICLCFVACDSVATVGSDTTSDTTSDILSDTTGETEAPETTAHVHVYGEWVTVKEATCTTNGREERSCNCGKVSDRLIPMAKHIEGEPNIRLQPTVKTNGSQEIYCIYCHKTLRVESIPATGSIGLAYKVNSDKTTCTLTGIGTCTDTEIYINDSIDGYKVTAIGEKAFAECTTITCIEIPETVTSIGSRAFYGCTGLSQITIPKSVNKIGTQIFYKSGIKTVYYNGSAGTNYGENVFLNEPSIENIIFGGEKVPNSICRLCKNLKSITLLDTVKEIGVSAFAGCSNLEIIDLGNGVQILGSTCFNECVNLQSIQIPQSVTSMSTAFYGCMLNDIYYAGDLDGWNKIDKDMMFDGSIYGSMYDIYINGTLLETVTYNDTQTTIKVGDFRCSSIKSIVLPDSIRVIAVGAFDGCKNLKSIFYMGSVEDWNYINIESNAVTKVTRYYYSNTKPTASGNYWRYVDGVPTPW